VNQQATEAARPTVLLLGDATARPPGLERALTRAGFHLVDRDSPETPADAVLISVASQQQLDSLFAGAPATSNTVIPRIVLLADPNPDGATAALALGAADALAGPVHFPELCARLTARIREHQGPGVLGPAGNGSEPGSPDNAASSDQGADALEHRVQEEFERARRYSLSFSLVLLGIDELQGIAERLGADTASRLRTEVSRSLRRELRVPDLVVPYGPDEFAILLPETGEAGARQSVIRVRERLTSLPFQADPRLEPSRFSAGIVTYPHPAATRPDDLFALAEAALMRGRAQAMERIGMAM
jgi:two-component system, cell cycle response regulator